MALSNIDDLIMEIKNDIAIAQSTLSQADPSTQELIKYYFKN